MQPFDLHGFAEAWSTFAHLAEYVRHGDGSGKRLDAAQAADLSGRLLELSEQFIAMGSTKGIGKQIGKIIDELDHDADLDRIKFYYLKLSERLTEEMEDENVFFVELDGKEYYNGGFQLFGARVAALFPDAGPDIDEAGKCYALDRHTACVFHLMRVTEYGIRAIAKLIDHSDPRPNWDPVLKALQRELNKPYAEFKFQGKREFLESVLSHMEVVKRAWRNRVMHVGQEYSKEQAGSIFNATKGLMIYLAEGL